jgi:hypothetical protein|tara:strand:- start:1818 stop:1979 length:162 start_codon:yes stop_codon:yes gene_type:complete
MEKRVTTSLSMQDILILLYGVERYAEVYPTTKAVTRVKNILDQAFNTILETKN